jgi:hypothetical protein
MAFVLDPNDPSGLGMFSKPGRFTTEKYHIFQKKDEILSNQRKFLKVSSVLNIKLDTEQDRIRDNIDDEFKPRPIPKSQLRPIISLMEKTTSREEISRAKDKKNFAPPVGFYNPRFKQVERKPITLFDYELEVPRPRECFTTRNTDMDRPLTEAFDRTKTADGTLYDIPIPEKPYKRPFGGIDFDKTIPRGKFYTGVPDPHEDRFTYVEFPPQFSKTRRVPTVDLTKSQGRGKNKLIKEVYAPDYNPNYEYGKRRLPTVASFDKLSPRKPMSFKSITITDKFYDSSPMTSHVVSPRFSKSTPRENFPNTPLPSFMQKPVTSRTGIEQLSQKTLEINACGDSKFRDDTYYGTLRLSGQKTGYSEYNHA